MDNINSERYSLKAALIKATIAFLVIIVVVFLIITLFLRQWRQIGERFQPMTTVVESTVEDPDKIVVINEPVASSSGSFLGDLLQAILVATPGADLASISGTLDKRL